MLGSRQRDFLNSRSYARDGLIFVDVDGVLLNFDRLLFEKMTEKGLSPPPFYLWRRRRRIQLTEAFYNLGYKDETLWALCHEIFNQRGLLHQTPYEHLSCELVGRLLSQDNVYILTKIPSAFIADRANCLARWFAADVSEKVLSSWTHAKGEVIVQMARRRGTDLRRCLLLDDNPEYLESALRLGAAGILVGRPYNLSETKRLRTSYSDAFARVAHKNFNALTDFLLEKRL